MKNHTPQGMTNLTPAAFRCHTDDCCPAVYKLENDMLAIIGTVDPQVLAQLEGKIGAGESCIVIDPRMLANIQQ